jgi:hypothetical protein
MRSNPFPRLQWSRQVTLPDLQRDYLCVRERGSERERENREREREREGEGGITSDIDEVR